MLALGRKQQPKIRHAILAALFCSSLAQAQIDQPSDPRFCGPPERYADGTIKRSSAVLREFERNVPKPQDERLWFRDHVWPLACGGCDAVFNIQWLHEDAWREKSRWERIVYGGRGISEGCP